MLLSKDSSVLALIAAASFATACLAADTPPDPHSRALAAGYKAAFICSGVFDAGLTPAQITADDLEGIYAQYQELVRSLPPAQIDRAKHLVSVSFDQSLPPRISA